VVNVAQTSDIMATASEVVILAGGEGNRLGSVFKPLVKICSKTLIEIVVEELSKLGSDIYVIVHTPQQAITLERQVGIKVKVLIDELHLKTPLAGLFTASTALKGEILYIAPCDTPFLKHETYLKLHREMTGVDAAIPLWPDGKIEPLIAVYRREKLKDAVTCALRHGEKSARAPLKYLRVAYVPVEEVFEDPCKETININTPNDLSEISAIC